MLLNDVLSFLESEGLINGGTGWTGYASFLPTSPDQAVAIFETGGLPPEIIREGSDEIEYDDPGFQIRVRGARDDYLGMRNKIYAIYEALHGVDMDNGNYVLVQAVQSSLLPLGLDGNNRPEATWNFLAMKVRGT